MPSTSRTNNHGLIGAANQLLLRLLIVLISAASVQAQQQGGLITVRSALNAEGVVGDPAYPLGFQDQYWRYDPFAEVALGFAWLAGPSVNIRMHLTPEYDRFPKNNLPSPTVFNPLGFEMNNVTGSMSLPFSWGSVAIGRQPVHLGESGFSSLMVSERVPWLDSLVLTARLGPLTFTEVVATIDNRPAIPDVDTSGDPVQLSNNVLLYVARYYEWSFGDVKAATGSQAMIARPGNAFEISDILPAASWHQSRLLPINLSITADIKWQILPGLNAFAMFGLDEINQSNGTYVDSGPPTTAGVIAGLRWRPPLMDFTWEIGSTGYQWGSYDDNYDLLRAIWRYYSLRHSQSMPLTSPYGPGASWVSASADWQATEFAAVDLDLLGVIWDPRANIYTQTFAPLAPSTAPWPWIARVSIGAEYMLPFGLSINLTGHVGASMTSVNWSAELRASWRYQGQFQVTE